MGVTRATPPNRPVNKGQLRRRNDGVEYRAFRRFGSGTCPEMPHKFEAQTRPKIPQSNRQAPSEQPGSLLLSDTRFLYHSDKLSHLALPYD